MLILGEINKSSDSKKLIVALIDDLIALAAVDKDGFPSRKRTLEQSEQTCIKASKLEQCTVEIFTNYIQGVSMDSKLSDTESHVEYVSFPGSPMSEIDYPTSSSSEEDDDEFSMN